MNVSYPPTLVGALTAGTSMMSQWLRHRPRALQAGDHEYILPVRLDDTEISGLLPTTGYIDIRATQLKK